MSNSNFSGWAGREIAGCELIRELGSGSSGMVYLAKQKRLERLVACKLLHVDEEEDKLFVNNLFSEARNAAKLDHPNVVKALDAGTAPDGTNYFLMEFVDGDSLEKIRTNRPEIISTKVILNLASQLSGAMDYAWTKFQMIHGDIKPGNMIIRTLDNELKICDLGLVRSAAADTADDDVMITPLYAAPEIIRQQSRDADPRSDIYSFGILLYELCCGTAPYQGTLDEIIAGHLSGTPVPLFQQNPEMDREMADFIDSMIAKSPEERPADWKEVRRVFGEIRKRLYPPATPVLDVASTSAGAQESGQPVTSWGEIEQKTGFFAKYPVAIPVILIIIIALAVGAVVIQLL